MISIIISSYQNHKLNNVKNNIAQTIGEIPYEIIVIDNPGLMSIGEAYNTGAAKSKYEKLLFLHEDVLFHTNIWGKELISCLDLDEVGLVGVFGSKYKSKVVSGFWTPKINGLNVNRYRILQRKHNLNKSVLLEHNPDKLEYEQVATLDGVFLGINKNVFLQNQFPAELKGFHAYDMYLCLAVGRSYRNIVTYNILIEHFSEGKMSLDYFLNQIYVHRMFKKYLPISIAGENGLNCNEVKQVYSGKDFIFNQKLNFLKKIVLIFKFLNASGMNKFWFDRNFIIELYINIKNSLLNKCEKS